MTRSAFGAIVTIVILALCACRKEAVTLPMPPAPKWKPNRDSVMTHPPKGMRFIKGGTFRMGGLNGPYDSIAEAKHIADSGMTVEGSPQLPSHLVTVGDFFMDTTEVTEREWASLLGAPPREPRGGNFPVAHATWYQAILFANAKSRRDALRPVYSFSGYDKHENWYPNGIVDRDSILIGLIIDMTANGYRLPTEAEYEYAARSGSQEDPPRDSDTLIHPVSSGRPNPWGIYDLLSNVGEWVNDGYDKDYYSASIQENPFGPDDTRKKGIALVPTGTPEPGVLTVTKELIVVRGPNWNDPSYISTPPRARQNGNATDYAGFRTVLQVR